MKAFQLAALFGGAVSAVQPLVGRDGEYFLALAHLLIAQLTTSVDGTTTSVVYLTSTYTITKCAASVTNCPAASATELFTSTTVMSVTMTICPDTPTPGVPPTESESVPSSSALPTDPPGNTDTLSDSIPTSYPEVTSGPSSVYGPPVQSSAMATGSSRSIDISVSLISPEPSLPVTGTDSVPTSSAPGASGSSSIDTRPVRTSALVTGSAGSGTVIVPRPTPSGSASLPGSLTDSVPTSLPPDAPVSSSSAGYVPSQSLISADPGSSLPAPGTSTGAVPTSGFVPSSGSGQPSAPSNTATNAISTSEYPGSPVPSVGPSSGVYSPYVSSSTDTASNTDAVPTSGYPGSSAIPSGSDSASGSSYTATNVVPTLGYPGSTALPSSGASSPSSPSNTAPDAVPTSGFPASSGYDSISSANSVGTNTDSVPTSSGPAVSGPSSSEYTAPESTALPTQDTSSVASGYVSGSVPVVLSSTLSTVSGTHPAVTSVSSGLMYPGPTPPASTTATGDSTRVTSRLTLTTTNYVTAPLPSSMPVTDTATDAVPTSRGTGDLPSGSGYPYPSGSANGTINGTIVAPTPSYIQVPVNMGQVVATGQTPIAAIVIALAFVLFA